MSTIEQGRGTTGLIDLDALAAWMTERGLALGDIEGFERLEGGSQNELFRFRRGGCEYVLRRGPRKLRPNSNEVMRREMRVLRALEGTAVAHPRLIAACGDESVLGGAAFYLMEPIDGFNPVVDVPEPHAGDRSMRHAMGLAAVTALATLGAVDHEAVGLGDLGRPDGYLERQVPRWLAHLESYTRFTGYDRPDLEGIDEIAGWLERKLPSTWKPGILHGDFHLGNLLFDRHGPEVVAIVDWEMCTIGDPLVDLGLLLVSWPDRDTVGPLSGALGAAGGLPDEAELVARYADGTTRDLTALDWYVVLAGFKTGIVVEGTHARARAGLVPEQLGERLHLIATDLVARALARTRAA